MLTCHLCPNMLWLRTTFCFGVSFHLSKSSFKFFIVFPSKFYVQGAFRHIITCGVRLTPWKFVRRDSYFTGGTLQKVEKDDF